ncbi:hypothetical protein BJX61DRAFT_536834 [Aspergillus egyptiacus]|nr:hypothetical protein BJX61DRAFT_536834 [Aspergillus egyptiacus]
MELTWLADTPQSRRRKRALRACLSCQRRKKRCRHLGSDVDISNPVQPLAVGISDIPKSAGNSPAACPSSCLPETSSPADWAPRTTGSHAVASSPSNPHVERFVGDLNPEAAIREKIDTANGVHVRDRVGLWINSPQQQRDGDETLLSDSPSVHTELRSRSSSEIQSLASILQCRYSFALKACDRLPRMTLDHLLPIYFSRVNHILPLVDRESFSFDYAEGTVSVLLERAICLVAAKDKAAGSHLYLHEDGPRVTARKFCSNLYNGLVCAMDAGLERCRVTRIRILSLMSLHSEGYEGAEAASMQLCQAIHQAQTAGLHLERPSRVPDDSLTSLFWCLWTLDKMHASIGGRPVLLADRDIGIKRRNITADYAKSAFDVWFSLSELLARVISFYRPSANDAAGWESDYPSFEEVLGDRVREELDFSTLGTSLCIFPHSLYYHAISILSARHRPGHHVNGSKPSHTRQGLAAVRVYSLVATECAQNLPPLPIVPYAVALSMGVSYHQFRSSKIITHTDRAKRGLQECCTLLEDLGVRWYAAEAMARLGRKALRQIEETDNQNDQPSQGSVTAAPSRDSEGLDNISSAQSQDILPANIRLPSYSGGNQHSSGGDLPAAEAITTRQLSEQHGDVRDSASGDGFTDIDTLFDDFLDLSLPTNFWDPVFLHTELIDDG